MMEHDPSLKSLSPDPLAPISTPFFQGLRRRGQRFTPLFVFTGVFAGCVYLWGVRLQPTNFQGSVEVVRALVIVPAGGLLTNLWVQLHQKVTADTLVAEVVTTDPRTVSSRLSVMRGQMQLTQLEMSPVLGQQRNALDYAQLGLSISRLRVEAEMAKVNLSKAKSDLARTEQLRQQNLVSEEVLEGMRRAAESLDLEVREKSLIVESMGKTLKRLSFMEDTFVPGGENDPLRQALRVQEAQTRALEDKIRPFPLYAPMDGVITAIHHRRGEQVLEGACVAVVTGQKAERIIGQLPQLFPRAVELGMPVAVLACALLALWVWRSRPWRETVVSRQLAWAVLVLVLAHSLLEYPLWYGPFQLACGLAVSARAADAESMADRALRKVVDRQKEVFAAAVKQGDKLDEGALRSSTLPS